MIVEKDIFIGCHDNYLDRLSVEMLSLSRDVPTMNIVAWIRGAHSKILNTIQLL